MRSQRNREGFTIIELLVSIAVFSILVAVGVGGFVNALRSQRQVAALIAAQSNAGIALEQMAREIRTGYLFCTNPGSDPGSPATPNLACFQHCAVNGNVWTCDLLDFYNALGQNVDYKVDPATGALARSELGDSSGAYVPITGDNVSVKNLTFTIFGNTEGDHWPPRITISLGIAPNSSDPALSNNILHLQTTVSAREIDCTQGGTPHC